MESLYMHPVVEAGSSPELRAKDEFERYNYAIKHETVNCSHPDCSVCYSEVQLFKRARWFLLDVPVNDRRVKKMNKLQRIKVVANILSQMIDALPPPSSLPPPPPP